MTQLDPPLPMETPKGGGWAHFLIDNGVLWVVFMDADGAGWTVPNAKVRMSFNWTIGRRKTEDLAPAEEDKERLPQRLRPALARQSVG
jgi:hypothetical protein